MNQTKRIKCRKVGGFRFPDLAPPPPGPLMSLAQQLALQDTPHPASTAAQRLLAELPDALRPNVLASHYTQVLEKVAAVWRDARALRVLFDELMFDHREGRNSLPFEAIVELTELKDHLMRVMHRNRPSVWDEALGLA